LLTNPAGFSLTFEIRPVNGAGVPTSTVLGSEVVSNIPETSLITPPRTVSVTFDPPVSITPGQVHALVVTGSVADYNVRATAGDTPCPDGTLFVDPGATDAFAQLAPGTQDLVYAVTLV
jgi:hypothetical protein